MKYIREFQSNKHNLYFDNSWKEVSPESEGIVANRVWVKNLTKKGFRSLIKLVDTSTLADGFLTYVIYLQEPDGDLNFMDYLMSPFIFKKYNRDYLDFAYEICENQLDFYNKMELFPAIEEIQNNLFVFTDEGFELSSNISYGYNYKINSEDEYQLVSYLKDSWNDFSCSFILSKDNVRESDLNINNIKILKDEFLLILDIIDNFKIIHFFNTRGLVISIRQK